MNLLLRAKLLTVSGLLALGAIGAVPAAVNAAVPCGHDAYPACPALTTFGGPGQVSVGNQLNEFTPGATVRLEVLTPGFASVLTTQMVTVDTCGFLALQASGCGGGGLIRMNVDKYVGPVIVMADQGSPVSITVPAGSTVYPLATISASAVSFSPGGPQAPVCQVTVTGSNFQATTTAQNVLVRDFDQQGNQVDWTNATPTSSSSVLGPGGFAVTLTGAPGQTYTVTADPDIVGRPAQTTVVCPAFPSGPGQISAPSPTPTPAPVSGGSTSTGGAGGFSGSGGSAPPRVHAAE